MTVTGIDIAGYQSETYSTAGLDFVVVKATEGKSYRNPKYTAQTAVGRKAGLVVGHYHYSHQGGAVEAEYFLAHSDVKAGEFVAFDWEESSVSQSERDAWMAHVKAKRPGTKVVLYCNRDFWLNRDTNSNCADGLWIADPSHTAGHPAVQHEWTFHQYSEAGGVDRDVANFASRAALAAWAGKPAAPKPPAKPKPAAKPVVDLSNIVAAARRDPRLRQGGTTHPADVKIVEAALRAEGLLSKTYAADGSFGSSTVAAYRTWQLRCGYWGRAADGIPGKASLTKLGARHGFTVRA